MASIEEVFTALSKEKKALKPEYKYKTAEEGLLRAHHFFRWCRNNNLDSTDKVVEQFAKKKVPEQQVEHFGAALVMIDHYETEPVVKDALREIDRKVREKTGKGPLEHIEPVKVERRILKNIYNIFDEAIERLKTRSKNLKSSTAGIWIAIAVLFVINAALALTGMYQKLLASTIPQILSSTPPLALYGGFIVAVVLFALPAIIILFVNRHKLSEHGKKGEEYPEEIVKMEQTLANFRKTLEEKKVQLTDKKA